MKIKDLLNEGFSSPRDTKFTVGDYEYRVYDEEEDDVRKKFHYLVKGDKEIDVDWSPYDEMSKDDVELFIKLGMPKRQGLGPLDHNDLVKMAQAQGVADLDKDLAQAEAMYKGKPYKSGNYGTGSAGENPPIYKGKKYQSGDAAKNPSDYKGKPYKSGDAGKAVGEDTVSESEYSKVVVKGNNVKIPTVAQQLGWKTEPSFMGQGFTTILPDSKPLTKDAIDKFIADLGLAFSSGDWAKKQESNVGERTQDDWNKMSDIDAKKAALQDIQMDPQTDKDPELKKELSRRKAELDDEISRLLDLAGVQESATAGATSSGNIASVANPHLSPGQARGKKSYIGDPKTGISGTKAPPQPKVKQPKTKSGTAKNALDMKNNIFGENPIRR